MSTGLGWYLDTIGRVPLLTPAEEIELGAAVRAWQDHPDGPDYCPAGIRRRGIRARDRFVHANLRLAVSYVSKRCQRLLRSADEDDVIQAANLGLLRAVERFDPTRGYKFSTYAYWWIFQSVNRFADCNNGLITRPAHHAQLLGRLARAAREHQQITGEAPTREQLALATGLSERRIGDLLEADRSCTSLDQLVSEHTELGDLLASPVAEEPPPEREQLLQHLAGLPPQDQKLLSLLYGLDGPALPAAEVAGLLGYATPREVRSHERAALEQLRYQQQEPSRPQPDAERFCHRLGSQTSLDLPNHLHVRVRRARRKGISNLKLHDTAGVAVQMDLL